MEQALLAATKASFVAMKTRLGSRASGGFLFVEHPFFNVGVELAVPAVALNPSLAAIQVAINAVAKQVAF